MILTEAQDNKVLVLAKGSINLVVEPDRPALWQRVRAFTGAIVASSLAGAAIAALTVLVVEYRIQHGLEARLTARIERLDADLNAVMAQAGGQSEQQSTRLISRIDQIGGKVDLVGEHLDGMGSNIDLLPGAIDKAFQGSAKSLVGWVTTVKPAPRVVTGTAPSSIRSPDRRRRSPP